MKNNLFLIVSEDKKLIDFNLFKILDNIEYDNNDKIVYDMNVDNSFDLVLDEASTVSLFSSIKVIIVNNFDIDKLSDLEFEYLQKYINSNNKDVYIILISNKVDARKKSYKLFKDNFNIVDISNANNDMFNYVEKKINNYGYIMSHNDIDFFLSIVDNDINNINNELDKLFMYKINDKKILREDINLLVISNIDNVIYEFTNAIFDEDYNKIKSMYDKFKLDNVGVDYLISTIAGGFRTALIIKLLNNKRMNNQEIAKVIGKKEFYVKKMLDRLYKYTIDELKSKISKLSIIDRDLKSGKDNIGKFEFFLYENENWFFVK